MTVLEVLSQWENDPLEFRKETIVMPVSGTMLQVP